MLSPAFLLRYYLYWDFYCISSVFYLVAISVFAVTGWRTSKEESDRMENKRTALQSWLAAGRQNHWCSFPPHKLSLWRWVWCWQESPASQQPTAAAGLDGSLRAPHLTPPLLSSLPLCLCKHGNRSLQQEQHFRKDEFMVIKQGLGGAEGDEPESLKHVPDNNVEKS